MEFNIRGCTLSKILDMLYTNVSNVTIINVKQLIADVQLFFKGVDTGLLPSHIYPPTRWNTKKGYEEVLAQEQGVEMIPFEIKELQERFYCIQSRDSDHFIFKITDTIQKSELLIRCKTVVTTDLKTVGHGYNFSHKE